MAKSLKFPESIAENKYALRKMTITAYSAGAVWDDVDKYMKESGEAFKRFTDKVSKIPDMILSNPIEAKRNLRTKPKSMEDTTTTKKLEVTLPLSNELSESISHTFEQDVGVVTKALDALDSATLGFASNISGNVSNKLQLRKPIVNPGYYQNYKGSEPRSFTFSYNFIPNSLTEAKQMVEIIMQLKKYSAPEEFAGGIGLLAPHFFDINFGNAILNGLMNIQRCVLTSIETNYSPSGLVETTLDGMPKYITLSLTFNEIVALDSSAWDGE
jgi:hypothetical protein